MEKEAKLEQARQALRIAQDKKASIRSRLDALQAGSTPTQRRLLTREYNAAHNEVAEKTQILRKLEGEG